MVKRQETLEMMELYRNGYTCREIGYLYGITSVAVWQRFKRAGLVYSRFRTAPDQINKERLRDLYAVEKLAIEKIAVVLGTSREVIRKALKLHRIPARKPLQLSGKYVDLLEKLNLGDRIEIQLLNKYPVPVLRNAARILGIKISLRSLGDGRFQVTRVEDGGGLLKHQQIDKNQLEDLFLIEELPIPKIAAALRCSKLTVANALKYYAIPKRQPLKRGGVRVDMLRSLAVGEETEIACELKNPITNLHYIAHRSGIKISVRSLGSGRFRIKRIEKDAPGSTVQPD